MYCQVLRVRPQLRSSVLRLFHRLDDLGVLRNRFFSCARFPFHVFFVLRSAERPVDRSVKSIVRSIFQSFDHSFGPSRGRVHGRPIAFN